jgi:sphinganine-1-phosphate aldolase
MSTPGALDVDIGSGADNETHHILNHGSSDGGLPAKGVPWSELRDTLIALKREDYDWRGGRLSLYVYHDNDQLLSVSRNAYNLYFSENALGKRAFPSLARMEDEILRMALTLFHAPVGARGSFTSGGTESLFLAMKAARDHFKATHGEGLKPKVIVPRSAHPALDKAAHYLDVEVVRVALTADLRGCVRHIREAIDGRAMMIVGSAPCYPFGVFDPIAAFAELALEKQIWLHVDACLGGFLAPFAREEGYPVPGFDFTLPGVSSLSADLHKYGFSARGASLVLYRSSALHAYQGFRFDNWPRGSYSTDTFLGSRPGGAIASAWAVYHHLGRSGYRRLARTIMETKERLVRGIEAIPGLEVVRPSELCIVLYRSVDPNTDIHAIAEGLVSRGWFVGRSREPPGIHFALNPVHAPVIDDYLRDLKLTVEAVRQSGQVGPHDDETY